jgi:signal transduction histidine kinase
MGEQGDLYIDVHRTTERDGEVVRLIVRDTGCGMSEAVRVRAFEPFFTTKPAGQGTGLGLSTIESIVVRFGGRMSLVTAPGKGATFMITLPIATNIASPMSTTPSDPHVGTTATSFLS